RLYFNLFLLFMGLTAISVFLTKQPLFKFSGETVYNDIFASFTIILIILLAFRNDWITYLPRREKIIYFSLGIFVYSGIIALPDYVYKPTASAYSLVLASATNIISLFLLIYVGFAMLKLFFHLPTAKAFDRKLKEVNSLYDLSRTLNSEPNFQKQTQLITQLTARVLGSSSTWFQLYNRDENRLEITSHINLSQSQILDNPLASLNGINQIMIQKRGAVLINDVQQHKQFRDLSGWKRDIRAFISAPLFSNRNQLMGIIYATKPQPYGFDIEDISLLEGFADQAAIALENANLFEASIKKERLEQELKIAREVQLKLLPQEVPATEGFELDSYSITAYEVGGDYYDFFEFGDGYFGVIIGDVSGKGTSAAFYMAEFKGVVQTLAKTFSDPLELICQANLIFFSHIERRVFVSAIVGKYIPEKSDFQFVRAGHNPLLHASNHHSPPVYVQPPGLAIGLDRGEIFDRTIELHHLKLEVGDNIILFTDGLTEARNAEGDEYGEERLIKVMENAHAYSAVEIKEIILEDVLNFVGNSPLHDDLTFIVMKRK
ncbi:MAG: SpoIIE family protein phosphatase, partial [Calditrichia bacterium]